MRVIGKILQRLVDLYRTPANCFARVVFGCPYAKVCHLLVLQVCGLLFAYGVFGVLNVNNPDGITVPPSFRYVVAFAGVTSLLTFVLILALGTHWLLGSREWDALGAMFIVLMLASVVWYRAVWAPSPYVTAALADHFSYLNETFAMLRPEGGIDLPSMGYSNLSDLGYPLLLAVIFESCGRSIFFVIAANAMCICGSTMCVMHLYRCRHETEGSPLYAAARRISVFQVLPLAVVTVGAVMKDSLLLFGVTLSIVAFYEVMEQRSARAYVLLAAGMLIVLLGRVAYGITMMAAFVPFSMSERLTPRRAASVSVVAIAGVILVAWAARSGLLVLQEDSPHGLATRITQPLEAGAMRENAPSSFIYRVTHPMGSSLAGQLAALPLMGGASWFSPFPFVRLNYEGVLHISQAIANMISLVLVMASWGPIKETALRVLLRQECSPVDRLMFIALVAFFIATAMSQTPLARYRMPFDLLALYFLFSQTKVRYAIGRVVPVVVMLAVGAHLLYFGLGGG